VRNLTKTLAVVSLLAPASGHPLGIGDIKLHSALNQNLNAEISLVLSPGEKVSDIKVNLAPSDKFVEAGVPWAPFLSKIKFDPVTRSNGSVVIRVSSREALKEPVLDLLLEVSWPKGNLYREFTVLVDPPSVYEQPTVPDWDDSHSYASEEDYKSSRQVAETQSETDQSDIVQPDTAGDIRTTGKNDTLWNIAEQASRGRNVSIEQMMIAIYKQNPRAFYKQNINALLAGKTLKIPERQVIVKLSRKQALAEFNRQTKDWRNSGVAAPVASTGDNDTVDNQLTLVAPTDASVAQNVVVAPENEQGTAEKKTPDQSTAASGSVDAGGESAGHEAATAAPAPVNDEIKNKLAELEKQLAEMKNIIALKDQQLATLQNQSPSTPAPQAQTTPPAEIAVTPPGPEPKPATQEPAVPAQVPPSAVVQPAVPAMPVTQEPAVAAQTPPAAVVQPVVPAAPVTQETTAQKPAAPVIPAQPVIPKKPAVTTVARPTVSPKPEAEKSSSLFYVAVAGVGFAMLTLVGWLWMRKNRQDDFAGGIPAYAGSNRTAGAIGESVGSAESAQDDMSAIDENFFLSDFSPNDFDIFDIEQGEIDPVSEADVYLAYGRYQQAEELMRDAIKDQPDRDECKLKLLEIYYSKPDKYAFETYARELADAGKMDDSVFWDKVAEMGSGICPDLPLFSSVKKPEPKNNAAFGVGSVQLAKTNETEYGAASDEAANIDDIDLATFDSSFRDLFREESAREASEQTDNLLDFDLSSFDDKSIDNSQNNQSLDFDLSSFEDKSVDDSQNNQSLDFDLGDFATGIETSDEKQAAIDTPQVKGNDAFESFDFDFNFNLLDDAKTKESSEIESAEVSNTDDKDDDDNNLIDFFTDKSDDVKSDLIDDLFDKDFDFDFNTPVISQGFGQKGGSADLTEMDEMETKLDLAMAYIDMGDTDAAKEIAREVLERGGAEQKMIAQALLDDLG